MVSTEQPAPCRQEALRGQSHRTPGLQGTRDWSQGCSQNAVFTSRETEAQAGGLRAHLFRLADRGFTAQLGGVWPRQGR